MLMKLVLKYGTPPAVRGGDATMTDDGVVRWASNGSVVPDEVLASNGLPEMVRKASKIVKDLELKMFLEDYRAKYKGPSVEERAEARAAHGPGVPLVNVITGLKWVT
jgi:hypothetical protein